MLAALLTPLAFVFTLGLIITVHEYGHFQVAKWCGVKVLKFSIGFGKPLLSKVFGKDQTTFVLASIPLGGYVKLLSEAELADTEEVNQHDMRRSLEQAALWKRMTIVLAGSTANLLLAVLLYWALLMTGVVGLKPVIGEVLTHSPAAVANLAKGETIQKINEEPIATWQDARWVLLNASFKDKPILVQTVNTAQEIHIRRLDLTHLKQDTEHIDQDILEKIGLQAKQPNVAPRIGEMMRDGAAKKAGLQPNDLILQVNQAPIALWESFVKVVRAHPNQTLMLKVARENAGSEMTIDVQLTPEAAEENGETIGRIGAGYQLTPAEMDTYFVTKHYSLRAGFFGAVDKTWETAMFSLKMLGNMLIGQVSVKSISGPITIASYAGQSANMGIKVFIGFIALISISIGVLNLLPIPVLDGGHFMYYMFEFLTGKPVPEPVIIYGQRIGLTLLAMMMMLAIFNDILRLITG